MMMTKLLREDIYLSAMRGADGTINVGYLVLFRAGRAVIVACFLLFVGGFIEMYYSQTHTFRMNEVGDAVAKIIGAFGILLAAVGAYLWGDSKQQPVATFQQTTTTSEPAKP